MVEDVLKLKSGGEAVLQEYQETEILTDATRRQMINTLVAHMIDTHGYFFIYFFTNNCMTTVQIKISNFISSLRQLPTKAVREQYALGIVLLFPSLRDPYSKKGYVSHCLHDTFMLYLQCYDICDIKKILF